MNSTRLQPLFSWLLSHLSHHRAGEWSPLIVAKRWSKTAAANTAHHQSRPLAVIPAGIDSTGTATGNTQAYAERRPPERSGASSSVYIARQIYRELTTIHTGHA
jgi:hypothetical protein